MEEEREDTLGKTLTKSFGSGSGRKWRSPTVTALGERDYRKKERNKRKKKRGWPNWYSNKGASFVGALLCHKGASEVDALPVDVA
jgi:hypothetical protein